MKRKAQGIFPGAILILGALTVALVTILIAWNYAGKMRYPTDGRQFINGSRGEVARFMAGEAEKCWANHERGGSSIREESCALVRVWSQKNITEEHIKNHISSSRLKENLNATFIEERKEKRFKILYSGKKTEVIIKPF